MEVSFRICHACHVLENSVVVLITLFRDTLPKIVLEFELDEEAYLNRVLIGQYVFIEKVNMYNSSMRCVSVFRLFEEPEG